METQRRTNLTSLCLSALIATLALPNLAAGQDRGYLFGKPHGSFTLRAGLNLPGEGSDLFDFTRERLTVDDGDFRGVGMGLELNIDVGNRLSIVLGGSHAESATQSEFRDWVGDDDLPIEQTTEFATTALILGMKYYLQERGRSVSSLAWVPRKVTPYVGGGGGIMSHRFEQFGEFVDFETLDIFPDNFESSGRNGLLYGVAGVDAGLTSRVYVNGEARYTWAKGELERDFVGFDDLDLSGLQLSVGIGLRF